MLSTKVLSIIVVAVVAVSAIGVSLVLLNDKGNSSGLKIDAELEVYGNANKDGTIDKDDADLIQKIIDGTELFTEHPLADANCDGSITEADLELVEKIIGADPKNKVRINIINHFDGGVYVQSVLYPVTAAVSTGAANTLLPFKYLGIHEEIKGLSYAGAPDATLFPEFQNLVGEDKRLSTSATSMSAEKLSNLVTGSEKVTALITSDNRSYISSGSPNYTPTTYPGVDVVRIQPAAVDTGEYMSTILILAFLFDTDGKGYMEKCGQLVSWYKDFFAHLNSKLDGITNKVSAISSSSNNTVSAPTSDYTDMLLAAGATYPLNSIDWGGSATKAYNKASDTWLNGYSDQIDYIIPMRTGTTSGTNVLSWYDGADKNGGYAILKGYAEQFSTMGAFFNENVYIVCGDMPVVLRIAYLAQTMYGDVLGDDFADNYHKDFIVKFFGWEESAIEGKKFCVSLADVGITP